MKFDLTNWPSDYIELKDSTLKELIKRCQKETNSNLSELSKEIDINYEKLRKFTCNKNQRKNILIADLKKIINLLNDRTNKNWYNYVENKILSIGRNKTIIKPKLPIEFSDQNASYLMGDLLTDGSLALPRGTIEYMNNNEQEIINNIKTMNYVFCKHKIGAKTAFEAVSKSKIKCKVYRYYPDGGSFKGNYPRLILKYPQSIGKFFVSLGLFPGKKVLMNPSIPDFIFNSTKEVHKTFLERVLINDGHVKPKIISIGHSTAILNNKPPNLLLGYVKLFNGLEIKTSKPHIMKYYETLGGKKRVYWRITITGRYLDIIRDNFNLNFKHPEIKKRNYNTKFKSHERIKQLLHLIETNHSIKAKD